MWVSLQFQPLRVVHFVFRGNSFRRTKKKNQAGPCLLFFFGGGGEVICSVGWVSREILVSEMLDPWGCFLCVCVCEWGWN